MTDAAEKKQPEYRIVRFHAENIKRLKAVSITPEGNVIELTGRNKQGKTSILDSIWWALTGATHIQASPIRTGEEQAIIELDLGPVTVTRKFRKKDGGHTTSVTVATPDGMLAGKPQDWLNAVIGELTMDPLEFARSKPQDQYDALKAMVPGIDFAAIESAIETDRNKRTDVNRDAKAARIQGEAITVPEGTPEEPIDEAALQRELADVGQKNTDIGAQRQEREVTKQRAAQMRVQADDLEKQAAGYRRLADEADQKAAELKVNADEIDATQAKLDPLPAPIDPTEISQRLTHAREVNANVAQAKERKRLLGLAAAKEQESAALTAAMEKREQEKRDAIAAAKLPVEGIGFGAGFITLNNLPFNQASDAEQLSASVSIAMALKPRLRVLRIRDGSLLDRESMALLDALAQQHNCQVWIETVDRDRPDAIVIEDGQIATDDAHKVAAE